MILMMMFLRGGADGYTYGSKTRRDTAGYVCVCIP